MGDSGEIRANAGESGEKAIQVGKPDTDGEKPRKICGAKRKGGKGVCQTHKGLGENGRCRMHGGTTPRGIASPNFKHGRWSQYLPTGIAGKYQEAAADQALMHIRQDVALVDAMLTSYTETLKTKKAVTPGQEKRILNLVDTRRRLIESEARRMTALQQTITAAQFMGTMRAIAEAVREFIEPEKLGAFQKRMEAALLPQRGQTDDDGEADS